MMNTRIEEKREKVDMKNNTGDEEKYLVYQLRKRIENLGLDEELCQHKHLIRWLRARDLKLNDAEIMLRKSVQWNLARISKSSSHNFKNETLEAQVKMDYPVVVSGEDVHGHPIVIIPSGMYDFKGAVQNGIQNDVTKHFFETFDKLLKFVCDKSENEPELRKAVGIVDFGGLSWGQCVSIQGLNFIISLVRDFESNYPEVVEAAYVVNAPKIFSVIYKLLAPVFAPKTLAKFQFYGSDEVEWQNVLLKTIPKDQLPLKYGGQLNSDVNLLDSK